MRLPYLLTAGHHLGIDFLTPLEKGREIPPAGLELGPEVVHIAAVRIAQCVGQVLIGHQGPAVAPVQAAQQDHRPTAVGPGIGEFEPQAHRQEDLQGFGLSRCRRAGIFAKGAPDDPERRYRLRGTETTRNLADPPADGLVVRTPRYLGQPPWGDDLVARLAPARRLALGDL